jgi:hypothetical protein
VCGGAMLVRADFLACAVVVTLTAWLAGTTRASILAFALTACVMLAPSTVWHWQTLTAFNVAHIGRIAGPLPQFAPVTSYGPFNFAMANHPEADGGPNRDHPMLEQCNDENEVQLSAGQLDLACAAIYDLYVHGYAIGIRWILEHPGDAVALEARKFDDTIGFLAHGYSFDDLGAGVDGTRRRVDMVDPSRTGLLPIHLGLLLWGVVVLWRRRLALGLLVAPATALLASTLLFYGYVRLGTAYMPAVWILQGAAIAALVILVACDAVRSGTTRSVTLEGVRTPGGAVVQDETLDVQRSR